MLKENSLRIFINENCEAHSKKMLTKCDSVLQGEHLRSCLLTHSTPLLTPLWKRQ